MSYQNTLLLFIEITLFLYIMRFLHCWGVKNIWKDPLWNRKI